ncbi:hypothetical protein [Blautia sp.]
MLEATFSPLIPTDLSEDFYVKFYNQFSFIQVNDAFIMLLKEYFTDSNTEKILNALENFHEDQNFATVCSLGAGIMNEALLRRCKENRGISVEIFNRLRSEKIDPLEWYEKAIEFLMIYAACEQAVKEYLISKGKISSEIKENKLLISLFDELGSSNLRENYIKELKNGSSSIITSQNELVSVWRYYTLFRHDLVHAGGRTTDGMKNKMEEVIRKNRKELENINATMFTESLEDDFFTSPFNSTVISITDKHLNFFRNMAILIVESLERAIHPDEYKLTNFNPYKL